MSHRTLPSRTGKHATLWRESRLLRNRHHRFWTAIGNVAGFHLAAEWTSAALPLDIPRTTLDHINAAVNGLVDSGESTYAPRGLLTRAWIRYFAAYRDGCIGDLNEVQKIAERGLMPLYLVDLYLTRARLFGRSSEPNATPADYPDGCSAKHDLDEAEHLINKCGYHRRDEELANARNALGLTDK